MSLRCFDRLSNRKLSGHNLGNHIIRWPKYLVAELVEATLTVSFLSHIAPVRVYLPPDGSEYGRKRYRHLFLWPENLRSMILGVDFSDGIDDDSVLIDHIGSPQCPV